MNPDPTNLTKLLSNSQVGVAIAKQLWPTMLFLVIMSIISLFGAHWWSSSLHSQLSIVISYWLWFGAMLIITAIGAYVFILDARIQFYQQKK